MDAVSAQSASKPKLALPFVGTLDRYGDGLSWLLIRLAVGGTLFTHGWAKFIAGAGVEAFAKGTLTRRGIDPALPLAYVVAFNEVVGALLIMCGLFTRIIAILIVIEFAVIIYGNYPNGYSWTSQGGGWEYPFLWALIFVAIALRGGGPYSLDRKLGWQV
jgi:putative oxidoreductase